MERTLSSVQNESSSSVSCCGVGEGVRGTMCLSSCFDSFLVSSTSGTNRAAINSFCLSCRLPNVGPSPVRLLGAVLEEELLLVLLSHLFRARREEMLLQRCAPLTYSTRAGALVQCGSLLQRELVHLYSAEKLAPAARSVHLYSAVKGSHRNSSKIVTTSSGKRILIE